MDTYNPNEDAFYEDIQKQMDEEQEKNGAIEIATEEIVEEYKIPEYMMYFIKKYKVSSNRLKVKHLWTKGGIARKRIYIMEMRELFAGSSALFEKDSFFCTIKSGELLTINGEKIEKEVKEEVPEVPELELEDIAY